MPTKPFSGNTYTPEVLTFEHTVPPTLMGVDEATKLAYVARAAKLEEYMAAYAAKSAHLKIQLGQLP